MPTSAERICPHGVSIGRQGGITAEDLSSCEGESDEMYLLRFYSACDCCDALMHHDSIGMGYKVMKDGRTLCIPCLGGERLENIDD